MAAGLADKRNWCATKEMRENDDTIFCCTIPVLCIMSFLISSELVPFSLKVSIVYIGLSFGFSLRRKNRVNYQSAVNLWQIFLMQFFKLFHNGYIYLFPPFPQSIQIVKGNWTGLLVRILFIRPLLVFFKTKTVAAN